MLQIILIGVLILFTVLLVLLIGYNIVRNQLEALRDRRRIIKQLEEIKDYVQIKEYFPAVKDKVDFS